MRSITLGVLVSGNVPRDTPVRTIEIDDSVDGPTDESLLARWSLEWLGVAPDDLSITKTGILACPGGLITTLSHKPSDRFVRLRHWTRPPSSVPEIAPVPAGRPPEGDGTLGTRPPGDAWPTPESVRRRGAVYARARGATRYHTFIDTGSRTTGQRLLPVALCGALAEHESAEQLLYTHKWAKPPRFQVAGKQCRECQVAEELLEEAGRTLDSLESADLPFPLDEDTVLQHLAKKEAAARERHQREVAEHLDLMASLDWSFADGLAVVYGEAKYMGTGWVFAPAGWLDGLAELRTALIECKTWEELRARSEDAYEVCLERAREFAWTDESDDDETRDEQPWRVPGSTVEPRGSFGGDLLGYWDGEWPRMPHEVMADWLPGDIEDAFCDRRGTLITGDPFYVHDPERLILGILSAGGSCERDDDLIDRASAR